MGAFVMLLLAPVGDHATRLVHGGTPPALAAAIATDAVPTLVMPVRPRTPRGKNRGSHTLPP
jgi:hypothetical protein